MLAKPSNDADGDRVTKSEKLIADERRNSIGEAYTGNLTGHRASRKCLKDDTAP